MGTAESAGIYVGFSSRARLVCLRNEGAGRMRNTGGDKFLYDVVAGFPGLLEVIGLPAHRPKNSSVPFFFRRCSSKPSKSQASRSRFFATKFGDVASYL